MKATSEQMKQIHDLFSHTISEDEIFIFEGVVANNKRDKMLDIMQEKFVYEVAEALLGTPLLIDHEQQDSTKIIGGWFDSYINEDYSKQGEDGTNKYVECVGLAFIRLNNDLAINIKNLVEANQLKGLSIGFTSEYDYEINAFVNLVKLHEVSLVLMPALHGTEVVSKHYKQPTKALFFGQY